MLDEKDLLEAIRKIEWTPSRPVRRRLIRQVRQMFVARKRWDCERRHRDGRPVPKFEVRSKTYEAYAAAIDEDLRNAEVVPSFARATPVPYGLVTACALAA